MYTAPAGVDANWYSNTAPTTRLSPSSAASDPPKKSPAAGDSNVRTSTSGTTAQMLSPAVHSPAMHWSPSVHSSESSQAVPSVLFGLLHTPVDVLHVPASWH